VACYADRKVGLRSTILSHTGDLNGTAFSLGQMMGLAASLYMIAEAE
jgi:hypothetical protein